MPISDAIDRVVQDGANQLGKRKKPLTLPRHMCPKLDDNDLEFVRGALIIDPHISLDELTADIATIRRVNVCRAVHAAVQRLKFTRKLGSRLAGEPSAAQIDRFVADILNVPAHILVWLDEMTSDRRNASRSYVRTPIGTRAVPGRGPFCVRRGTRIATIAAMDEQGLVAVRNQLVGTLKSEDIVNALLVMKCCPR